MNSLITRIAPSSHDLGAFTVRRTLPSRGRTMVGPFIFVDQIGPARLAARRGHGRAPAPAHQSVDRDLSVRRRDRPPRQPRHYAAIEPGAVNLMTAGRGIVHSERTPADERERGASALRHADLARPARRARGDRPRRSNMSAATAAADRSAGVDRAGDHGQPVGRRAPTHEPCRNDLRRHQPRGRARASRSTPTADERAVLLVEGEARSTASPLESTALSILEPGRGDDADRAPAVAADAARRRSVRDAAPRVVELRQLVSATASTKPNRSGRPAISRSSPATTRNLFPSPPYP